MGDQVEEDESSGTCAECNVKSSLFNIKTSAHWSLDVEHFFDWAHLAVKSIRYKTILRIEACFTSDCSDSLSHHGSLRGQIHFRRLIIVLIFGQVLSVVFARSRSEI